MAGEGHNCFVSSQGEGQNFLGALFSKLVALPPPPPPLNNDISLIWLANFASFEWLIRGPITYGTNPDGPVTFTFLYFCFPCTLFEMVIFTNEMANHFGFDKGSLRLEIL